MFDEATTAELFTEIMNRCDCVAVIYTQKDDGNRSPIMTCLKGSHLELIGAAKFLSDAVSMRFGPDPETNKSED